MIELFKDSLSSDLNLVYYSNVVSLPCTRNSILAFIQLQMFPLIICDRPSMIAADALSGFPCEAHASWHVSELTHAFVS